MKNPFKKKRAVAYKELPGPVERIKRLERAVVNAIQYGQNNGWAAQLLVDLRDIREELEKGNYMPVKPGSLLLEPQEPGIHPSGL